MWPFKRREPESPEDRFKQGTRAIEQGHLAKGIDILTELTRDEPTNIEAAVNLGAARFTVGDFGAAEREFGRALEHSPDNPKILLNLAAVKSSMERLDEAIDLLMRILEIDPQFRDCHYNLAIAYWRKGHVPEAMAELELELALHPDHKLARELATQIRERHGGAVGQQ